MKKLSRYLPIAMIVAVMIFEACSAKKNTAGSRFWQAFTTRYNVYYHGKTNYDEQIKILENDYEDDYSQRVFIHPAAHGQHKRQGSHCQQRMRQEPATNISSTRTSTGIE